MKLTLGFSPCPNDTYIFDALVNGKLDSGGLEFEPVILDIDELNNNAETGRLAITKISFNAFAHLTNKYNLLNSGAALGKGCGPLLVAKEFITPASLENEVIAIPGENTTANFLLSYYGKFNNRQTVLFSNIEDIVQRGKAKAGLIIHENRFTYQEKGLKKLVDLGAHWEETTGYPIPLGGIAARKDLTIDVQQQVSSLIKQSVKHAFNSPDDSLKNYIKSLSQELEDNIINRHIALYVNNYTLDLGNEGREAVRFFVGTINQNAEVKFI